jgi:nuclear transport factor 2 (NTF2) superfamily protein
MYLAKTQTQPWNSAPHYRHSRLIAKRKVQLAEDAWNSKTLTDSMAYTIDTIGETAVNSSTAGKSTGFLKRQMGKELDYVLKKELWSFTDKRIAVRFEYEWHDAAAIGTARTAMRCGTLTRTADAGTYASINDAPIVESDRG